MVGVGVTSHYHDSSCALMVDDQVVFALQEEGLSRIRFDSRLPRQAIRAALAYAGISPGDLDYVAYYERPDLKQKRQVLQFKGAANRELDRTKDPIAELRDFLCWRGPIHAFKHHESHAAYAF